MSASIYKASPRKVREWAVDALTSGCVPFVKGSPGIGKSSIFRSIAEEFRLEMIDHRISTSQPEDFTGLPDFERNEVGSCGTLATFRPFDIFPIRGRPIPKNKDGWLLFLDEANSGMREVQAAAYKLTLDRMVGQFHLHDNVLVAMAGNLATDKAIVNNLGTAMQSRLVHILMEVNFKEWYEDVAIAENYDERIRGYLSWKGSNSLMNFDPDHDDETFPCPRTWEFMNRLIKGKTFQEIQELDATGKAIRRHEMDSKIGLYAGTIGQGEAVSFVQYCKNTQSIITLAEVLADPAGCRLPQTAETKWAQIAHFMDKVNDKNFADLTVYIDRYDICFKVLFYQTVLRTNPDLKKHPAYIRASLALAQYLYA